ncbi:uncharacterized protein PV09_05062 [Verruconis gallopava]|uniref:F-box domain-containing protein n=1 Tax=Verruconis gallopava TaxID=253628 RepID=A0A0D1YSY6_9PEZI|nr:uncharacterized protein PV09_05062 [Verruconis gallopava]KIW03757.1 hypothetical protein PV09_05062 [Verruconis gallopava]
MSEESGSSETVVGAPVEERKNVCLLLQLPVELRLQIYQYLLTSSEAQLATLRPLTTRKHLSSYLIPALNIHPNILRTCRLIHEEAGPILYKSNTFCAHPTQLTECPFLVSSDRVVHYSRFKSKIRKWYISLRLDIDSRLKASEVEAAFTGVDSLEIEVWQAMFASADLRVLKLFEGVRDVSTVKIHGSVSRRYSDWLARCMTSCPGAHIEPYVDEKDWDAWTHGNR